MEPNENSPLIPAKERTFPGFVLEFAVLLLYFSIDVSATIFQNQIIYQTCTQVLDYNNSECILLGTPEATKRTEEIETQVQPYAASIFMVRSIVDSIIPAIGVIFIGGWSDRFGRKPVILAAFVGFCSMHIFWAVLAFLSTKYLISPWFYILVMIPNAVSGSKCSLMSASFSYIADITNDNSRGFRMTIYQAFLYVGIVAGYLSSSVIFHATNAYVAFAISGVTIGVATLLISCRLKESVRNNGMNETSSVASLFQWNLVTDMLKTCFKRRPRWDRTILWLIILTLALNVFVVDGSGNVFFLFVRKKFAWTLTNYTFYEALSMAIQILGNTLLVYSLQTLLGASAISIALLSYGSCILDSVIKGTTHNSQDLYIAAAAGILKGITGPMCRSIMTTFVPATEIGKLFSFISAIQVLTPLASAPVYTEIYRRTIQFYPGLFNLVSVGFYFICFIFITIVFGIIKRHTHSALRDFPDD